MNEAVRTILSFVFLSVALVSCARKPEAGPPEHQYKLTGKVVSVDSKHQTAMIDAAAIPGFMEAMAMEYPIKSKTEFDTLHAGDNITATVNVYASGAEYNLSNIRKQGAGK